LKSSDATLIEDSFQPDLDSSMQTYLSTVRAGMRVAKPDKHSQCGLGRITSRDLAMQQLSGSHIVLLPGNPLYTKVVFTLPMRAFHTGYRCAFTEAARRIPFPASNNCAAIPARTEELNCCNRRWTAQMTMQRFETDSCLKA
jgi:hypothetical protein